MSRAIQPRTGHGESPEPLLRPGRSGWADDAVRETLAQLAETVREGSGFEVVAITILDDQGQCENVAVAAPEDVGRDLLGTRVPRASLDTLLAAAQVTGSVHFTPEQEAPAGTRWAWCPEVPEPDPQAWHGLDWLGCTVHDDAGSLAAVVQLDLPRDRRRPDAHVLALVDQTCTVAAAAITAAREADRLTSRARMATTARDVLRGLVDRPTEPALLEACRPVLTAGFRARGMLAALHEETGADRSGTLWPRQPNERAVAPRLLETSRRVARQAWAAGTVVIVDEHHDGDGWFSHEEREEALAQMVGRGVDSVLLVPVGAGSTCLGSVLLARAPGDPSWTHEEVEAAPQVGQDLGRALLGSRERRRQAKTVTELRDLDTFRDGLIATVAHEMRSPLAAVTGHAELISAIGEPLPAAAGHSAAAITRAARRLERIVENLLLLARSSDPDQQQHAERLDLRGAVVDVRDLHDLAASRRDQHVVLDLPPEPVWVQAIAADLDCAISNLVGNALKYSGDGTTVRLRLTTEDDEVVLVCADEGLGIAEADLPRIFAEFYRSADPAVRRAEGTGLGLAIVSRIVQRHLGRVTVASRVGEGSEFVLHLPSAAAPERHEAPTGTDAGEGTSMGTAAGTAT